MEVAVGVSADKALAVDERKLSARLVVRLEAFALRTRRRLNQDPLDIVLFRHRMLDLADANGHAFAVNRRNGNVLLFRRVDFASLDRDDRATRVRGAFFLRTAA